MYQNDGNSAVLEPLENTHLGLMEHEVPGAQHHYQFGRKSAGLIGLSLVSDGTVYAFASHRPPAHSTDEAPPPMCELYRSSSIKLQAGAEVRFELRLTAPLVGLLAVEVAGWIKPYEINRAHFLGYSAPFGTDEIDFPRHSATRRPLDIPANRAFAGVFRYDPSVADYRKRAVLTLTDLDTNGQTEEHIFVSALDDEANGDPGGVFVNIRMNADNYGDGCATLKFTDGHTVDVTDADGNIHAGLSRLALNTTASPV